MILGPLPTWTLVQWPRATFHLDQGCENQIQEALPFWVTFYLHRIVFSAKQTKKKESQQDIRSLKWLTFQEAKFWEDCNSSCLSAGKVNLTWRLCYTGYTLRGSGETLSKNLLQTYLLMLESPLLKLYLWHKPNVGFVFCTIAQTTHIKLYQSLQCEWINQSFLENRLGWRGKD